ncbi:MAG: hypothetical protein KJ776_05160 [Proteobacteria bacterium]|jgi:vacuolar-type H+-ATPase subunit I/STV1|nr:hypothetical protein [Pseudomonadota bacterium]
MDMDAPTPGSFSSEPIRRRPRTAKPWVKPLLLTILSVAVWGGLLYGAYYYATDYIDSSIRTVQETNALHVQALNERLDAIQVELEGVKDALEDADRTLASSDSTRAALSQRITELDRQLAQLQQSLNVLRKSPDVKN